MGICKKIKRTITKVCVGSMNRKIEIFSRALTPPIDPLTGKFVSTETFVLLVSPWSMVETPKGVTVFDDLGQERVVNTVFTIRFFADLTSENWIVYKGQRYDILMITDFQQNELFLQLSCALSGNEALEGGKA